MQKLVRIIKTAVISLALVLGLVAVMQPAPAYAAFQSDAAGEACQGVGAGNGGCTADTGRLTSLVNTVINLFSAVVGIAAVIMLIVGGFKYITSAGDSGKASSAKNTIIYAVVGLVVVALAQFIVKFVLDKTA